MKFIPVNKKTPGAFVRFRGAALEPTKYNSPKAVLHMARSIAVTFAS